MKRKLGAILVALTAAGVTSRSCAEPNRPASDVASELTDKIYLYEVARYLYRWHLDERDLDRVIGSDQFVFWVAQEHPTLDLEDRSRFGTILLPQLGVSARVKQADYEVPELGTRVTGKTFKITSIARAAVPQTPPSGFVEIRTTYTEMRDYLFQTRNRSQFPDEQLLMRMRLAVRNELLADVQKHQQKPPPGAQTVHLAPLSPVANEAWVFWETGRLLIRFSADLELDDPVVWDHIELVVDVFDIDEQVVVSLDEVAGSNAYLTRDQVGRVLFNCLVLGKRLELQPLDEGAMTAPSPG